MATVIERGPAGARTPLGPDRYERVLGIGAALLLAAVLAAVARGHGQWDRVPGIVWAHLATIGVALALTPVILLRRRGDLRHRRLGRVWLAAMLSTALLSFAIRHGDGGLGPIHVLSAVTLVMVPVIWWSARTRRIDRHRRAVRAMVTGALLVAGFFTFPFHRLLGTWLFG